MLFFALGYIAGTTFTVGLLFWGFITGRSGDEEQDHLS